MYTFSFHRSDRYVEYALVLNDAQRATTRALRFDIMCLLDFEAGMFVIWQEACEADYLFADVGVTLVNLDKVNLRLTSPGLQKVFGSNE